jgi:hypothetical protein
MSKPAACIRIKAMAVAGSSKVLTLFNWIVRMSRCGLNENSRASFSSVQACRPCCSRCIQGEWPDRAASPRSSPHHRNSGVLSRYKWAVRPTKGEARAAFRPTHNPSMPDERVHMRGHTLHGIHGIEDTWILPNGCSKTESLTWVGRVQSRTSLNSPSLFSSSELIRRRVTQHTAWP